MRKVGLALFVVNMFCAGTAFGQRSVSGLASTIPDLGATVNSWIDLLPTIDGYKTGVISIPGGIYTQSTTIHINSPRISIIGAGSGAVEITCLMDSPCWDIRLDPFVANPQVGGQIGGFTLIGQSGNSSAVGIHMGDITEMRLEDILIEGFTGPNAVGLWWENINGWTERINVQRVNLNANTTDYKFSVSGKPGTPSFCYNQWLDLRMFVGQGQKGIDFQSGDLCGSTFMVIINGTGSNKTYINLTGPSFWHDNLYDIKTEESGGGGVRLATAAGTVFNGTGLITSITGSMSDSINGNFSLYLPYILGSSYSSTTAAAQWYLDKFANLQVQAWLPATASANFSSPLVALKSNCWDGSATGVDQWQFQNVLDRGANPPSTFQFSFTPFGCTSTPQVQVADGIGNGILLSTTALGMSPRIRHDTEDNVVIDTGGANATLYLNADNNRPVRLGDGKTAGANIPILASLKTIFGTSTNVEMDGVTSSSHCSLTATNGAAAAYFNRTFISAKVDGQITVAHAPVADMTYDILCTPN